MSALGDAGGDDGGLDPGTHDGDPVSLRPQVQAPVRVEWFARAGCAVAGCRASVAVRAAEVAADPALVSRSRVTGVQATGAILACWSSYSIGVSIPSAVWRRR